MDTDDSGETTITLIVKTPNQAFQDQTVEGVLLSWTVKDLKMHLSAVYPSRPVSEPRRKPEGREAERARGRVLECWWRCFVKQLSAISFQSKHSSQSKHLCAHSVITVSAKWPDEMK